MCGIAGIVDREPLGAMQTSVRRMMDLLVHRGPDDEGVYETAEVCLGHRRLAIIDLSPGGHQPMIDGSNVLVFNGEIYNHKELRRELEHQGIVFHSRCDTEVLLRGYRAWGEDILLKAKGMFAFALWDGGRRRLFCARDPFGEKPFYFFWGSGRFVFASEVEAVVAGLDSRPKLDYLGISHYLLKGYFASGRSVYETIDTLRPGHYLTLDLEKGALKQQSYWSGRFELGRTPEIDYRQAVKSCGELIAVAVQSRCESDVPVGVLLSGGVDSSLVSLAAAELLQSQLRTFTATFTGNRLDESRFALQVASSVRSKHLEVEIKRASLSALLSRLVQVYGEPFGDFSAIPTLSIFEAVKPHVTVALTGDGGDELFAGYKDTKLFLFRATFLPFLGFLGKLGSETLSRLIYHPQRKLRELGYAMIAMGSDSPAVFYSLHRDGWTLPWRKRLMRSEAWRYTGEDTVEREEAVRFMEMGRTDLERYLNLRFERLSQAFLTKIDRASMAHSVEARCPLLDVDLFEWVSGLSEKVLLPRGQPKGLLKGLLASQMGRHFANRPKMGFTPPLCDWLRQRESSLWLEERLIGKQSFAVSLFPPESIRRLIDLHRDGQDHAGRLWNLLFLAEWHARVYENYPIIP